MNLRLEAFRGFSVENIQLKSRKDPIATQSYLSTDDFFFFRGET